MYPQYVRYDRTLYGVKSAAQTFFNKVSPTSSTCRRYAVLVGVVYPPTRTPCRRAACGSARGVGLPF